ncbi:hypothetical protein M9H77_26135 [Catharanthus roseus]|uniref:Uncharacterized protein n=1 Tax=Catharanthus roseus TaxID=4058 RepID=A0ACC0A8U5_CATRO|nr:hypothetical protein M9H77_26135 [Catharanthus roseus]
MPLLRVELRNEYGLGAPELYAVPNKEDPKEVLEGVAVAGLVGILRQLGDLAEFAAEVFHGLQEQVMVTSSRSQKLMARVKQIEIALPPLEKLVLAQRSHLHFAYTAGANWHVRCRSEQNHFIYSDLPRFIQDSYEQCRGPPQLNLLDKFDTGGPGSCLKRYSDPSFFRKASTGSEVAYSDKVLKDKKGRKIKKRRSGGKNGEASRGLSMSSYGHGLKFASFNVDGHTSPSQTASTYDALKSDLWDRPISLDSRNASCDFECVSHPRYSMQHEEQEFKESSPSSSRMQNNDSHYSAFGHEKDAALFDDIRSSLSGEQTRPSSFSVTLNEKAETLDPTSEEYVQNGNGTLETVHRNVNLDNRETGASHIETGEGHGYEKPFGKFLTNVDQEKEERATHCETREGFGPAMPIEEFSTNINLENATTYSNTAEECDDESLLTFSANIERETEIGDSRSENAKGYDYDEPLQQFSGIHGLEAIDRGGDHFDLEYDLDESLETFPTNPDQKTEAAGGIQFMTAGQMDIHFDNDNLSMRVPEDTEPFDFESEMTMQKNFQPDSENVPFSASADLQHEDVESETDHYVDALNSIESEYDTDLDSQPKQEVEHYSDTEGKAINHEVGTLIKSNSCSNTSGSSVAASSSLNGNLFEVSPNPILNKGSPALSGFPDKETSEDIVPFESHAVPQPTEIANESSNSSCLADFDSLKTGDALGCSEVKSVIRNVLSSNSRQHRSSVPMTDTTNSSASELQKPPPEPSSISSIQFWTNGGLLGLEPSKPPDCSVLNASSQVSLTSKDCETSTSSQKPDIRDKIPENIKEAPEVECGSCQGDRKGGILTKKASWTSVSADLSVNLQKLSDSYNHSYSNSSQKDCSSQNCGTVQPVTPDVGATRTSQEKSSNSSRIFELGNRLLLNGFYRKSLLDKDETPNQTSSLNDSASEQKMSHKHAEHKTFSRGSKDMLGSRCPILSPSSSPPLGHMKMSFQPVNGFEAPKLQLKFPDGNVNHEGGRDLFPSFQLVPETTVPLHEVGSDSDDDTFCRSSPSRSDCPSHESDSNSEQWESSDSPRSNDQELYDALRRISLTESVSTSGETGTTIQGRGEISNICKTQNSFSKHSLERSQSGYLVDIPGLDSIHPSLEEESRNHYASEDHHDPDCTKELTPPPPLPPPQWRSMKSQIEMTEDRQVSGVQNLSHEFDWKLGYTVSQQPKPAPVRQEQNIEAADTLKIKQQVLQKIRVQNEVNQGQGVNGKEMEEKEDFLHQIRTKSFSLRRTEIGKPTVPTGTPTSLRVTAILQKANAIRQAVGSDDGEDDNWSDT